MEGPGVTETQVVMRGGRERKRGTEPKQSMWKVALAPEHVRPRLPPRRSLTEAQTTLPERLATARDLGRVTRAPRAYIR